MAGLTWAELMHPAKESGEEKEPLQASPQQLQHTEVEKRAEADVAQEQETAVRRRGGRQPLPAHRKKPDKHAAWFERHNYVRYCMPMPKPLKDILVAKSIREKIPTHKMVTNLLYDAVRGDMAKPLERARSAEDLLGEAR